MISYENKLVIFGGAGPYINSIKMRLSYNDVHIFDPIKENWLKEGDMEDSPLKRMSHSCSIIGSVMMIHGGFNTE